MSTTSRSTITVDELEQLVKRVEPAAFLVPPRLMRRVIKQDRGIGGVGLLLPHRQGYVVSRQVLRRCVDPAELGLAADADLPPYAYLIVRLETNRLARYSPDQVLVKHWRILFHLHIDQIMQRKLADGSAGASPSLTTEMVRERIRRLGMTEFAEIRAVLRQEKYLLPPESIEAVYGEFVAVYLTLRRFDPARLAHFFPALGDVAAIDALVAEDIDADAIFEATRLPGEGNGEPSRVSGRVMRPAPETPAPYGARLASLLSDRLKKALELSDADADKWRESLPAVEHSAHSWSQEARFLVDLRCVCDDSEHGIWAVDLVEWALSLGQLKIQRRLPGHQDVAVVRHLRRALERMRFLKLADDERQRLLDLLNQALAQSELHLRERFRPLLAGAFDEVGLQAHNVAEEIGRAKLVEDLLDRVVEHGHLSMGNLRDAISSNQLKLPDLTGLVELVLGDPLIRLNRKLAVALDGVYRRGEIYMRLLHRLSSAAFGNVIGRWLVLYLILPFGLAFFAMITPRIVAEEGASLAQLVGLVEAREKGNGEPSRVSGRSMRPASETPAPGGARLASSHRHEFPMPDLWGVAGLGIFFLLVLHVAWFRRGVFYGMGRVGQFLQTVFINVPVWLVNLPALQAILHNRFWTLMRRFLFWPALMGLTGWQIASLNHLALWASASVAVSCVVLCTVIINTRLGRDLEEAVTDWLVRRWVWFTIDFVPGLLHLIMDVSRRCLEAVEQMLYTVNEWLRFRTGENRVLVAVKAGLGLLWFGVTYVLRFAINLLIEPQVNPIKHFPVVTLSHKVCIPLTPTLAHTLIDRFGLARRRAWGLATGIITGIPGIFGFMAWELKENWRLYASNRPARLKPVPIGSHGETMLRLLRPGFHSGTVPKLYRKLRKAERHRKERTIHKVLAELHHLAESVAHFIERELLALLRQSRSWSGLGGLAIELAHIHLASNRVVMELSCPSLGEQPLLLAFDQRNGWLLAGVLEPGWLPGLNDAQRQTLTTALAGLYKMAGVHLTREQITANLPPTTFAFDITSAGLAVWSGANPGQDAVYDLGAGPEFRPQPVNGSRPAGLPVLDTNKLLFTNTSLTWDEWVNAWEEDRAHESPPHLFEVRLLPIAMREPATQA